MKCGKRNLYEYYADAAAAYGAVDAVFERLAGDLLRLAGMRPGQSMLDVGTGWGAVAAAGPPGTVGVDFVHGMVRAAQQRTAQARFCTGDMHRLPFAAGRFDAVVGQFAFNNTQPERAFTEARRVLLAGGVLALHEWGEIDPLSEALADAFAEYMVSDPPPEVAAYREAMRLPVAWDALDGLDGLAAVIASCGFTVEMCAIEEWVVRLHPAAFVRYKLAWPARRIEMSAMLPELRTLCEAELHELMASYREPDGLLSWEPDIVRVRAIA